MLNLYTKIPPFICLQNKEDDYPKFKEIQRLEKLVNIKYNLNGNEKQSLDIFKFYLKLNLIDKAINSLENVRENIDFEEEKKLLLSLAYLLNDNKEKAKKQLSLLLDKARKLPEEEVNCYTYTFIKFLLNDNNFDKCDEFEEQYNTMKQKNVEKVITDKILSHVIL